MQILRYTVVLLLLCTSFVLSAQSNKNKSASEIKFNIQKLKNACSVLYIAAHPDDENTRLLSYLSNYMGINAYYLSVTRGDGGQNLIGNEQGDALGMIRTQELLAARNTDNAKQYFTRAKDFGYSKTPEETFSIWNKDSVLSDMVWIIRKTKPELIIARFPTNGDGGHGHHTASAILAEMAFDAAADPNQFKWQLKYVQPWKAKRLLWNAFIRGKTTDATGLYKLDVGLYLPHSGKSVGEVAADSRSNHKSQGFGSANIRGEQIEYFKHIKGDSAKTNDIFEGIATSVSALKGAEKYLLNTNNAYQNFSNEDPSNIIPDLIKAYKYCSYIKDDHWALQKKYDLQQIIQSCLGLHMEVTNNNPYLSTGDKTTLQIYAINRSASEVMLQQVSVNGKDTSLNLKLNNNQLFTKNISFTVPNDTRISSPYWLTEPTSNAIYTVPDISDLGNPWNKPSLEAAFTIIAGGETFTFHFPVQYKWTDPVEGEKYREVCIAPAVTANLQSAAYVFKKNESKEITVTVETFTQNVKGKIILNLPEGWKGNPMGYKIDSVPKNSKKEFKFTVTAPDNNSSEEIAINFYPDSAWSMNQNRVLQSVTEIKYNHIPYMTRFSSEKAKLVCADYQLKTGVIGYIPGAGDKVMESIVQMGGKVEVLTNNILSADDLKKYDVIVTGIRAYNTNEELVAHYKKLMEYIYNGGTLLVQYNTNSFFGSINYNIGPYPFKISRDRVTEENAAVTFTNKSHLLLNKPNTITSADFENWVQERGLYFANEADKHYETVLLMNDKGEEAKNGSLIVTQYGKGYFIYTGLAFFRELPAGVPGAYRLFANLLSCGNE